MKKILLILGIVFSSTMYSQKNYAADKYFDEFAYTKSAALYQEIFDRGDKSYQVIGRLADSYYQIIEFSKAETAYRELMHRYENIASTEHIFRYAQVLKSNGKIKESDEMLLKIKDVKGYDSRVEALEKKKNYYATFSNRPKKYFDIKNVSINSKYSDFGGFLNGNQFYFASTRPNSVSKKIYRWNEQPFLNLYTSNLSTVGKEGMIDLNEASKVMSLNGKSHESNLIISKDGTVAYFTRDNLKKVGSDESKLANLKIFKATRMDKNSEWGAVEELPFNNEKYSVGHPFLSPDEKTLYFVSDMPGGFGNTDIYKVAILSDGAFGEPENLGRIINTEGREMFPFIAKDSTMYFSSDGHLGLGALDIFKACKKDSAYQEPFNLGIPINGPLDDFAFLLNQEQTIGFFSSNRKEGLGDDDIYSFRVNDCSETIQGIVTNARSGIPIEKATVQLFDIDGEKVLEKQTTADGSYQFDNLLCKEEKFRVIASKKGFKSDQDSITTSGKKSELQLDLGMYPLIVDDQIVINPIYFDFGKYNIREDAKYELEHVVNVMQSYPELIIKIESHTDSRGSSLLNRNLSDKRAKATRDYIISRGIAPNRVQSAIGYGEDQLLNGCNDYTRCTEEQHKENRRSYFYIVSGLENEDGVAQKVKVNQSANVVDSNKVASKPAPSVQSGSNTTSVKAPKAIAYPERYDDTTVVYKVQIATSRANEENTPRFNTIPDLEVIYVDGVYKYYCCQYFSLQDVKKGRLEMVSQGFEDAFIVPFINNQRVTWNQVR